MGGLHSEIQISYFDPSIEENACLQSPVLIDQLSNYAVTKLKHHVNDRPPSEAKCLGAIYD
ncbi:hypothetical protein ACTXT7_017279 [Hymenolepis weldensis]